MHQKIFLKTTQWHLNILYHETSKKLKNLIDITGYNTNIFLYQHYETRCHLSRHRKTWNVTIVCLVWNAQHVVFRNSLNMFVVVNWDIFRKSFSRVAKHFLVNCVKISFVSLGMHQMDDMLQKFSFICKSCLKL